jgi:hypothetical protein
MELPDDVLQIIREYSKPLTRPDWRTLNRLPLHKLYREIMINKNKPNWNYSVVLHKFIYDIQRGKKWSDLYEYSEMYGIDSCSKQFGIQLSELMYILYPLRF